MWRVEGLRTDSGKPAHFTSHFGDRPFGDFVQQGKPKKRVHFKEKVSQEPAASKRKLARPTTSFEQLLKDGKFDAHVKQVVADAASDG